MFSLSKKNQNKSRRKRCVAVVPAAGSSSRMQGRGDKLFAEIGGIPVIARTLLALQRCDRIDSVIVTTKEEFIVAVHDVCKEFSISKVSCVIRGGDTRCESVIKGIEQVSESFDLIAVHDAARPFASVRLIEDVIAAAEDYGAAAPALPLKDTVKVAERSVVCKTIPRDTLFAVQTPQVFDSKLIAAALRKSVEDGENITDDCSAVERIGSRVHLTRGEYFNIKITTPEDLIFAEAIAAQLDANGVLQCE